MTTYIAIARIRTVEALFLPGEEVRGLSEADATELLAGGVIARAPDASDSSPKTPPKTPKPDKKGA